MEELISVIVPVYGVEKYLRKCLDSVCGQTWRKLEIILVDDGSPDGCGAICDEYAARDSRVKVIHKENGGLSDARNAGLEAATGRYIGFVDSDDYIRSEMYETMLRKMKSEGADLVICGCLMVDEGGNILEGKQIPMPGCDMEMTEGEALGQLMGRNLACFVIAVNRLYKAELLQEIRFPVGKLHEDEFVAHYILGKCRKVCFLREPLYCYVQRSGSIMAEPFTLKRLDGAEAWLDRAQYAMERGMDELMSFSCRQALDIVGEGYRQLDRRKPGASEKIRELRQRIIRFYPRVLASGSSLRGKIIFTCFLPHIRCYLLLKDIWLRGGGGQQGPQDA